MSVSIIGTRIGHRPPPGQTGVAVVEFDFDKGKPAQHIFELVAGEDIGVRIDAIKPRMIAARIEQEIQSNVDDVKRLGSQAAIVINTSSIAENAARLREEFKSAGKNEAVMIGDFLAAQSDARLRSAFGFSQAQVDDLRARKLDRAAQLADEIRSAGGE